MVPRILVDGIDIHFVGVTSSRPKGLVICWLSIRSRPFVSQLYLAMRGVGRVQVFYPLVWTGYKLRWDPETYYTHSAESSKNSTLFGKAPKPSEKSFVMAEI